MPLRHRPKSLDLGEKLRSVMWSTEIFWFPRSEGECSNMGMSGTNTRPTIFEIYQISGARILSRDREIDHLLKTDYGRETEVMNKVDL